MIFAGRCVRIARLRGPDGFIAVDKNHLFQSQEATVDNSFNDNDDFSAEPKSRGPRDGKRRTGGRGAYDNAARPRRLDDFTATHTTPDYKDYERLRRYVSSQGKILPRRRSGLSAKNQRLVARAIKRARHLALLPMPGTLNK